jgi:16S rRNA (cytidine1402-2'-O)-methyltransferase
MSLYIIPTPLSSYKSQDPYILEISPSLKLLLAESKKGGDLFIRNYSLDPTLEVRFVNEHSKVEDVEEIANYILDNDLITGIISDAGTPCVADPGAQLVSILHENNYPVIPIPGPSAIIMALSASGLNGQEFTFHGYLSRDGQDLQNQLNKIANEAISTGYSQIFIETPYRNQKMLETIIKTLSKKDNLKLCIAANLTAIDETVFRKRIAEYENKQLFENVVKSIDKKPSIFILGI